jgi:hypothetical protein
MYLQILLEHIELSSCNFSLQKKQNIIYIYIVFNYLYF